MRLKIKILFVEDNDFVIMLNKRALLYSGRVTFLEARTLEQARAFLKDNSDIEVIVWDADLGNNPNDPLETLPLVRETAATFKGIMIANSKDNNEKLIEAGCSKEYIPESKETCHKLVKQIMEKM